MTQLAAARTGGPALGLEQDVDHRFLDDHTGIEPVLLGTPRMGDAPEPFGRAPQPSVAILAAKRVSAGGNEIHRFFKILTRQVLVRRSTCDFDEEFLSVEG